MTAKVISLCDYRRSREEEKRSKRGSVPDILKPAEFHRSLLSAYDPDLDLDDD